MKDYSADFLRQRFSGLAQSAGAASASWGDADAQLDAQQLTAAAVLVPLVQRASGLTLLLTQRTAHLRDHAGQISFPGGRCEEYDTTLIDTAVREAREEVGLEREQLEILGFLPEYRTLTGFRISPAVALVQPPLNLKLDDFEVAEVFEVPLAFVLKRENFQRHQIEYAGKMRDYYALSWKGYFIWGATAGMLMSLQRLLVDEV